MSSPRCEGQLSQVHNNKIKGTFYARNVPESPVTASPTISQEKCPACCPQITLPIAAAKGWGRGKNSDRLLLGNIPPLSSEAQPILLSLDISKKRQTQSLWTGCVVLITWTRFRPSADEYTNMYLHLSGLECTGTKSLPIILTRKNFEASITSKPQGLKD